MVLCCGVNCDFHIKRCLVRLCIELFVRGLESNLRCLCGFFFACGGIRHILRCVFCFVCLRLVFCVPNVVSFSGLSILDCHFCFL